MAGRLNWQDPVYLAIVPTGGIGVSSMNAHLHSILFTTDLLALDIRDMTRRLS
jgi:hypothetical protein